MANTYVVYCIATYASSSLFSLCGHIGDFSAFDLDLSDHCLKVSLLIA